MNTRWFAQCCAISIIANGYGANLFAGSNGSGESATKHRADLRNLWAVESEEDTDIRVMMLMNDHAQSDYLKMLSTAGAPKAVADITELIYNRCGKNGISAFDLIGVMEVSISANIAGFISYEDSTDYSKMAGSKLQATFKSWQEAMDSYISGCLFYSKQVSSPLKESFEKKISVFKKLSFRDTFIMDWKTKL